MSESNTPMAVATIRTDTPNTPDDVIDISLVPHFKRFGWSPTHQRTPQVRKAVSDAIACNVVGEAEEADVDRLDCVHTPKLVRLDRTPPVSGRC